MQYLDGPLRAFAAGGGRVDSGWRRSRWHLIEAVSQLLGAVGLGGAVFVVKHLGFPRPTFHPEGVPVLHPRSARSSRARGADLGVDQPEKGGLFTNYEFGIGVDPDLADPQQARSVREADAILDAWAETSTGLCVKLDANALLGLHNPRARRWEPRRIAAKHTLGGPREAGRRAGPPRA